MASPRRGRARKRGGDALPAPLRLKVERRELANGLTLLAARTRAAPTLALVSSFEVDQVHEPAEHAGIAHLVGETLDEGTERWSGPELAELVEGLGGYLRTTRGGALIQVASEDVKKAVRILGEVTMRPTFPAAAVRRAKALNAADIAADQDDPQTVARHEFRRLVYGDHPFARDAKGTVESIDNVTPARLRSFHKKWFTPDNGMVVGIGDVDTGELLDLLAKTFRSFKGKAQEPTAVAAPRRPGKAVNRHIAQDRAQMQVYLGHIGIARTDPDYYKLVVMDHVLGSGPGFTSRITRKLRDEQGLCYAVGAGIASSAGREPGTFTAYIGTQPGAEQQAIAGFLEEMRRIRSEPPSKAELTDVKAYLTGSFVWALERNANLARFLLRVERFGLGDDYLEKFPRIIDAVTADEVREVAETHLDPERYYCVTLGKRRRA